MRKGDKQMKKMIVISFIFLFGFGFAGSAFPSEKDKEFGKIGKMGVRELTAAAKAALEKKYPLENWERYKFPKYVYTNDAVQNGYKIAVKEPLLLAKFPCYCFCEEMGHKNLAYCFLEKGSAGEKFDDHASTCNICYTQAMRAFLWNILGATEEEMQKEIYGK
jgi:hypothetical protein